MSMPEQDDFFRRLGKKLDTELPFEQLPEEWANISAQIPGKPPRKKIIWWWWWLLFLLLLGTNLAWYAEHQKLRNELQENKEALVAARHSNETNAPADAINSGNKSATGPQESSPENHVSGQKRSQSAASNQRVERPAPAPLPAVANILSPPSPSAQPVDTVRFTHERRFTDLLFPILSGPVFFKSNSNLYIVRLADAAPATTIEKTTARRFNWQINPFVGYPFLKNDSLPVTRGTELGLRVSRRMIGGFSIDAGASRQSWQFGLNNPAPGLMDTKDTSCPYCPLDTILVTRRQWTATVSLMYEKEIAKRLAVQLGLGWTYVPRFNQQVAYRYIPVYGGPRLTVAERNIPVAAYSLAHVRAGLVFPAQARFAGLLTAQYDVPLKAGTAGWWALQAGWRIRF